MNNQEPCRVRDTYAYTHRRLILQYNSASSLLGFVCSIFSQVLDIIVALSFLLSFMFCAQTFIIEFCQSYITPLATYRNYNPSYVITYLK